jgi:hypothetical protein
MKNEIEVIDGVAGEWRTVTKPSEVKVGQRVRFEGLSMKFGYEKDEKEVVLEINNNYVQISGEPDLFGGYWRNIQAFFPLPVRKSRKVAKVRIDDTGLHYWWSCKISTRIESENAYSKRSHAIRGARRFCKAIGYECEIVK